MRTALYRFPEGESEWNHSDCKSGGERSRGDCNQTASKPLTWVPWTSTEALLSDAWGDGSEMWEVEARVEP